MEVDLPALVGRYSVLSVELAAKYQTRGDTQGEQIKAENTAWSYGNGLPVTERRESAKAAGAQFAALIAKDTGDIQALETEIAFVQTLIHLVEVGKL